MPPKKNRYALLSDRLPRAVEVITEELDRVMQVVSDTADINVNLTKECILVHDANLNLERTMNGLQQLDVLIQDDDNLKDFYSDIITAQKNYSELKLTLSAIDELRAINNEVLVLGDDLAAHKNSLQQRCMQIVKVIKGDYIPLPTKIISDMTKLMETLAKAKQEPVTPVSGASVDPMLPSFGAQSFAASPMFSSHGYMPRLDEKLLPSFDGQESSYAQFKENFQKLTTGYEPSYLQMVLSCERVMKDKPLRLQLQQIATHAAQWTYLDQLFKSRTRQMLCIFNSWDKKGKLSESGQIVSALAEFSGAINQLEQMTKADGKDAVSTSQWLTVLLLEMLSKKLPKEFQDKLDLALGSMDVPDVPKLLDILEQQRGALLMRSSHGLDTPSKKKGNPAAAAAAVGKPGTPSKFKKKQSCPSDGCSGDHFLFKCSKFTTMSVPERKDFVMKIGVCLLCLNKGHRASECPRAEKLGGCRINNCGQKHNSLLHESVAQVSAVYEAPFLGENNYMLMLQKLDALDVYKRKVPVSGMWDTGANLTMVTQSIAKKLQLPSTGRVATISMADGKVQSCPTVKLCLVDSNKNKQLLFTQLDTQTGCAAWTQSPQLLCLI